MSSQVANGHLNEFCCGETVHVIAIPEFGASQVPAEMLQKSSAPRAKGESTEMKKLRKVLVLLLTVAVVSLGLTGCKGESEQPSGEHPSSEHPSTEHPSSEHPSAEDSPNAPPSGEHPSSEHPQ